jgi:hypothetical protein
MLHQFGFIPPLVETIIKATGLKQEEIEALKK